MALVREKSAKISYLHGGRGATLLCLHGIPGSSHAWLSAGQHLTNSYQLVIPDLVGFGQSDLPEGDYYLRSQAAALRDLLAELEIAELYIAGHDFGGPVAITLLDDYPELRVLGLVLAATNVFTDTYVPPPLRLAQVPVMNTLVFTAMVGNRLGLRLLYLAATKNRTTATWDRFRKHLTPSGIDYTRRIFQRSLADLEGNYRAVETKLGEIQAPTLVLWGDRDPFFSVRVAERVRAAMRNSELTVYPATGHFVPEERPDQVAADIWSFFKKQAAP